MNYYKRHIGDYFTKAGHLSMLEHGAYNVLIDRYYNAEQAPTRAEALRWTRARTDDEVAAVDAVLAEFFTESDGRFVQSRVEEEVAAFHVKQEANRALGAKGGKANAERIASETLSGTLADVKRIAKQMGSECEANGVANAKPSQEPITTNQEKAEATTRKPANAVSPEAVVAAYHEALPNCARIAVLSPTRRRKVQAVERMAKAICQERGWEYGPDFWRDFFSECATDPWYRGDVPNPKNPAWKQSLDVLLRDEHFAKIMDAALAGVA